jgi:hypothetical protein
VAAVRKYSPWFGYDRMTVTVWSPFLGRNVMVTPTEWRILVKVAKTHGRFTQRQLAALAGVSLKFVNHVLKNMDRLGVIVKRTRLGRLGWTRASIRDGVHLVGERPPSGNVSERSTSSSPGYVVPVLRSETFSRTLPWMAVG